MNNGDVNLLGKHNCHHAIMSRRVDVLYTATKMLPNATIRASASCSVTTSCQHTCAAATQTH
jgi:hypothetical protein